MLVLFETAAGYAVFKLLDEKKLKESDNIWEDFQSPEAASKTVQLVSFKKFKDTTESLEAAAAIIEGKLSKTLRKFLKKNVVGDLQEQLAVADAKMGSLIKDKCNINCVANNAVNELMRGIRSQMDSLITDLPKKDMAAMALGLAHSLSRYKLKFSPDKVDTMIIQAVSLLDDLDKELNNYIMRTREWYGWHFPELGKIVQDNLAYAKLVRLIGLRTNTAEMDLSEVLPEELSVKVKEAAEISMGTEISDLDMLNISQLCDQVIEITEYRSQLYEYLKNRMMALAPNLTVLLGELVGARLVSHAGSLMNLAKYPASTVQILGAEKALFRALKTKKDTPKYGLIYHAQLIGQAPGKLKGKMSRMLAAKAALACRVDALGEDNNTELGIEHKAKLESRLQQLQDQPKHAISGTGRQKAQFQKHPFKQEFNQYDNSADASVPQTHPKKHKFGAVDSEEPPVKRPKVEEIKEENGHIPTEEAETPGKAKKKKMKKEATDEDQNGTVEDVEEGAAVDEDGGSHKKKKKSKKAAAE